MKASLLSFHQELGSLRYYLKVLELESELLAQKIDNPGASPLEQTFVQFKNHVSRSSAKRTFDYNSIIVSLYGFFEQYIESSLRSYAATVNGIVPAYEDLPEVIRNKHIELSYQLITRVQDARYRSPTTIPEIIANLHSCMTNAGTYKVNTDAYAYHSANFRTSVIDQTFSHLGISTISKKIKNEQRFVDYLLALDPTRQPDSIDVHKAFSIVDDLADRRNDVAHGISAVLLSMDILETYVDFFDAYAEALYNVLRKETLQYSGKYQAVFIGTPIAVYNNSIVCISVENLAVKEGDTLIACTPNNEYFDGEIVEIQVNNTRYTEIVPGPKQDIALKVPFKAKDNQTFMLLPKGA